MSRLRLIAISMSVLIHASIGYIMLPSLQKSNADALNLGHGIDIVLVEQGIATEGLVKLGDAMQTIEMAEIFPVKPPPQSNEVKPHELRDVIASDANSVEEGVVKTQEPPAPPKPDVQIKEQQPQQVAILTEQSSGKAKTH